MLVTSFSPTRLEAQDKAVQSWKQHGLSFRAVQCIGEDYAKDFTDDIEWVKPNLHWSKRTPSLMDIFKTIDSPTTLINSDIELEGSFSVNVPEISLRTCTQQTPPPEIMNSKTFDWKPESNVLRIGIRTDYCPQFTQLNKYGFDAYLITPETAKLLVNNSIWGLGIPGCDYWIVWKLLTLGYTLDIHKKGFLHAAHKEQWNKDDYRRCSKLLEFEFDVPVQDIADTLQELTGRTHLSKKTL